MCDTSHVVKLPVWYFELNYTIKIRYTFQWEKGILDNQYFPLISEYFKCLVFNLFSFSGGVKPDKGPKKAKKCSIQWNYRCYNFTIWLRLHRLHVFVYLNPYACIQARSGLPTSFTLSSYVSLLKLFLGICIFAKIWRFICILFHIFGRFLS